ncbi:tumor necrosis factor receptor superfamily member 1A [Heteronotia binoei]|uniref:tumor necrosis factor receptor superfamily member 1A n=1 Tax=Heteronotia binoei TaxID=13085 RepID=UPI00292D8005|nr:tumor necrosis factor receptor superfamily member 1A [Heteronotia binoei]
MVLLGPFPVLATAVVLILIHANTGGCLGMVPTRSNVHSHGVPEGRQPFVHSSSRGRRDVQCGQGYYRHPNRTHCCMRCHKGTYVSQHCVSEDRTPTCVPCSEGSFTDSENSATKCRGCRNCLSKNMGQVVLTNCSSTQDTVCGCPSNHYRTSQSSEFRCLPCNPCHNGTVFNKCSKDGDTGCSCHRGFFLQKKSCIPCSSCQGEECKKHCDVTFPSMSPSESPDLLTPILGCLVVLFAAAVLLLVLRRFVKQPVQKKLISALSIRRPERHPSPTDPQLPQLQVQVPSIPQEPNQKETLLPSSVVPVLPDTQELPNCQPAAENTQIPDNPAVLYAVIDNVPFLQWKEFVRRLGLPDNDIGRIQVEEWNMRDAQYKMLRLWRLQLGQHATFGCISSTLQEMELSGCSEAIQEALSR